MKNIETNTAEVIAQPSIDHTTRDAAIALLIVSVVINLFFLIGWVTLRVTTAYDAEVANFLFIR
jgi:hypothetical protein